MMSDKLDKFTKRARHVLTYAQEEAVQLKHNYIGTGHLLLGLLREEEGTASQVLHGAGLDIARVREAVESITGRGQAEQGTRLSLTPRTKRVIELTVDEARRLGHHYFDTGDLLLGILREGTGTAVQALKTLGANPETLRTQLLTEIQKPGLQFSTATTSQSQQIPLGSLARQNLPRHDIFIVHGHDEASKESVARFVEKLGLAVCRRDFFRIGTPAYIVADAI